MATDGDLLGGIRHGASSRPPGAAPGIPAVDHHRAQRPDDRHRPPSPAASHTGLAAALRTAVNGPRRFGGGSGLGTRPKAARRAVARDQLRLSIIRGLDHVPAILCVGLFGCPAAASNVALTSSSVQEYGGVHSPSDRNGKRRCAVSLLGSATQGPLPIGCSVGEGRGKV